ncbi:MAG: response regulator transcription factor [Chryseobacterium sp.]|nr:MAG: response regulator transcription factor [Chryseobacterium sp.]
MLNKVNVGVLKLHLNELELKVLDLVSEGLTNKEIGFKVFRSSRTIESNRTSLLLKTSTRNTAALMAFAFRSGILV